MTKTILVCTNFRPFSGQPSCAFRGSKELAEFMEREISSRQLDAKVERTVCMGQCALGPNVRVPGEPFIHQATEDQLIELLDTIDQGSD